MMRMDVRGPLLFAFLGALGCTESGPGNPLTPGDDPIDPDDGGVCTIDQSELLGAAPRDGIPAITDPFMVSASHSDADYLLPDDRIIGLEVAGAPMAIPHNILWWHEIANLNRGALQLAVTYCPLTGTAVAFDRAAVGGAEFGVSGLLFRNNLVMYDRTNDETLWPQVLGEGVCGLRTRTELTRVPVMEMTWEAWKTLHPNTTVVSDDTGFSRDYTVFPYGDYEELDTPPFLPQTFDQTRPPKERTLGLEGAEGTAMAIPFGELDTAPRTAHRITLDGELLTILWDRAAFTALAFNSRPLTEGSGHSDPLTLEVVEGEWVDAETGSTWDLAGRALSGPLAGSRLPPHPKAMVAFWFAWGGFHPSTLVYLPTSGQDGSGPGGGQ